MKKDFIAYLKRLTNNFRFFFREKYIKYIEKEHKISSLGVELYHLNLQGTVPVHPTNRENAL